MMRYETLPRETRSAARWRYAVATAASIVCLFLLLQGGESRAFDAGQASFVPTAPCRLFDTRPGEFNVGFRDGPLAADDEVVVDVTGTQGECVVPAEATAVSINLTGLDASAPTFVAIWPAGATNPGTSALNLLPGQTATPNKIDVQLSADGAVTLYNAFGSVHLIGDVMGYYTDGNLTDLHARVATLEAVVPGEGGVPQSVLDRLDALEADVADLQAANAELETANAELQTANAELETANAELQTDVDSLMTRVGTLEANEALVEDEFVDLGDRVDALEELTGDMSVEMQDGVRTIRFEGVNVQIVNGSGTTSGTPNGSGNLIVGYNAQRSGTAADRSGSHNLVVGDRHEYVSYGGAVMGYENSVWGPSNSVLGGWRNVAGLGSYATVSGGSLNEATGNYTSISGGYGGSATANHASINGGWSNTAQGVYSSILGGRNVATTASTYLNGGWTNNAISVVGGYQITCGNPPSANYDTCYDLNNWYAANPG